MQLSMFLSQLHGFFKYDNFLMYTNVSFHHHDHDHFVYLQAQVLLLYPIPKINFKKIQTVVCGNF